MQVSLQVRMENVQSYIYSLRTKFILAPFDMPTILLGRSGMISTSKHLSFQMEWSDRSRNCFTRRTSLQVSASDTNCKSCTRLYWTNYFDIGIQCYSRKLMCHAVTIQVGGTYFIPGSGEIFGHEWKRSLCFKIQHVWFIGTSFNNFRCISCIPR